MPPAPQVALQGAATVHELHDLGMPVHLKSNTGLKHCFGAISLPSGRQIKQKKEKKGKEKKKGKKKTIVCAVRNRANHEN